MNLATEQVGNPAVRGYCPMGCGKTLFLGNNGFVTCSYLECPEPDAVSTFLETNVFGLSLLKLLRGASA